MNKNIRNLKEINIPLTLKKQKPQQIMQDVS